MENSLMNAYATPSLTIAKGEGSYLFDIEGNKYIDFTSGIGVSCIGYNNPKWTEAIETQIHNIQHCSNLFLNPITVELSNKITLLSNMSKVFFANSGAEANEGAIKLARKYSFDKYGEGRNVILTLKQSFHGRTMATLKATGQPDKFHKYFFPFPGGFEYVEANNIEDFKNKLTGNVCAIMMEAIQGEGGVHPLDKKFVEEVASISKDNDILVIFDEIQCGLARTGKLYGFNHYNVDPDIITLAKGLGGGLPIGAVLCNDKLASTFKPGDHGSTFGGNPVVCAGALAVLDIIGNDDFYNKVTEKGNLVRTLIKKANLSEVIDVRGRGLMIGIEIKGSSSEIQTKAIAKGLLVLTAGPNIIRLLPPLVIDDNILEDGINILIELLQK